MFRRVFSLCASSSSSDFDVRDFRPVRGMRGLSNYRLSCCVNSLLQTLSSTWELTELIERWDDASVREDGRNVPLELKRVLTAMQSDSPQPAPHRDFLRCLDRNHIHLGAQHDADEVFLFILNLVQQQMDDSTLTLSIQNLYKISTETLVKCLECSFEQTMTSFMLSLPLHVREDDNYLESCMSTFFEPQELRGINCCYCANCGFKRPSEKVVKLLALPPILCVHLKRFRNSKGYTRKLDCRVSFPETLDLSEILTEALSANFAQSDCRYTLYAVVVHSGFAECGHYTAYVRNRGNQCWYYTDDSHVQKENSVHAHVPKRLEPAPTSAG
ncbi:ubl carboxyl-terminal hydrolase 18 isoform 2-T2 [Aulostomus maculatus]